LRGQPPPPDCVPVREVHAVNVTVRNTAPSPRQFPEVVYESFSFANSHYRSRRSDACLRAARGSGRAAAATWTECAANRVAAPSAPQRPITDHAPAPHTGQLERDEPAAYDGIELGGDEHPPRGDPAAWHVAAGGLCGLQEHGGMRRNRARRA